MKPTKTSDMLLPGIPKDRIHHKRRNTKKIPSASPLPPLMSPGPAIFVDKRPKRSGGGE